MIVNIENNRGEYFPLYNQENKSSLSWHTAIEKNISYLG
jgi:hypothetical protein